MIKKDEQHHRQEKNDQSFYRLLGKTIVVGTSLLDVQACHIGGKQPQDICHEKKQEIFRTPIQRDTLEHIQQYQLNKVKHDQVHAGEGEPE